MGKLRDYESLISFIKSRLGEGLTVGQTVNLLEPKKARDYTHWINEDFIKGILKEIEKVEKKAEDRKFRKREGKFKREIF